MLDFFKNQQNHTHVGTYAPTNHLITTTPPSISQHTDRQFPYVTFLVSFALICKAKLQAEAQTIQSNQIFFCVLSGKYINLGLIFIICILIKYSSLQNVLIIMQKTTFLKTVII